MKAKKYWALLVISICVFVVVPFLGIFTLNYIYKRSDAKIDMLLERLNEGMSFSKVAQIFGRKPERTFTSQNDAEEWGTIKDSNITAECNLHMFGRHDVIPHRYILVYEDKKNHTVKLVTTKGM
ncbi:MAG: hypothetical protein ACYTBX_09395 [Planctomycetota bacterium]|jgi:hypothetical protein